MSTIVKNLAKDLGIAVVTIGTLETLKWSWRKVRPRKTVIEES